MYKNSCSLGTSLSVYLSTGIESGSESMVDASDTSATFFSRSLSLRRELILPVNLTWLFDVSPPASRAPRAKWWNTSTGTAATGEPYFFLAAHNGCISCSLQTEKVPSWLTFFSPRIPATCSSQLRSAAGALIDSVAPSASPTTETTPRKYADSLVQVANSDWFMPSSVKIYSLPRAAM